MADRLLVCISSWLTLLAVRLLVIAHWIDPKTRSIKP